VDKARAALVISNQEAQAILHKFDPAFTPLLSEALARAESDIKLRAALNRVLFTARNATFAQQCTIELDSYKLINNPYIEKENK
jgi:hypothetical protein